MKSIAGLQDTFTLSLVKGAAKRVRPKVPAAGEAWQGGEVASHEVHRAPGTLCHAGKKELLTLYTFCSAKSSYNHPVPLRQFWNNSETIWGQLKDNLGTIRDKLETTVGQFFDSTRRKFWKILEITLGQLLDEIKTTLGQHCDYLVIIVGTYLCPATNDHFFLILHTISTVSMPISWGVFPDRVAKPLVRSVSMKPGEQLVLVM